MEELNVFYDIITTNTLNRTYIIYSYMNIMHQYLTLVIENRSVFLCFKVQCCIYKLRKFN